MEIKGKIIHKLDLQTGISKAGNEWRKQEYVLETLGNYPKKVKFDFFGERIEQYPLEVGDVITVSYDIESREFNGKWYTEIRAFNAVKEQGQTQVQQVAPAPQPQQMPEPTPMQGDLFNGEKGDDLPF
jgi:hypothetical protein